MEYYRNCHFYWIHRAIHPWFGREKGLLDCDIGAFLYRHAHSVHHKSYNTGPWGGLAMHPIEQFFYYTCATLMPALSSNIHPLVFLHSKFHADISPVGGHDGHAEPGGGSDYHQLHHAKFECNYGVPYPVNFDKIFGTWQDTASTKRTATR
jgi:sterol desaturase/sphingolipid hydroxylase (fatty acid hydroxylase superfamily)